MFFLMRDWFLDKVELREWPLVLDVARDSSAMENVSKDECCWGNYMF